MKRIMNILMLENFSRYGGFKLQSMTIEKWLPLFNSITRLHMKTNWSLTRLTGDFVASGTALGMQVDGGLTYPTDLHPVQVCSSKKVFKRTPFTSLAMRFTESNIFRMYDELVRFDERLGIHVFSVILLKFGRNILFNPW